MKKILTAFLPALSLLTLGSCVSTSQLASTEDDGVYYSSKDRTTQNATVSTGSYSGSAAQAAQSADANVDTDEATNPEYRSGSSSTSSAAAGGTEYYDEDYSYAARIRRFNQPVYRGLGYGYYDLVYTDPFWYGGGGYSPYGWGPGYYGAFYDPFYSPYAYGGSYISINIGFGRPYYNPWRYGYGGYGYNGYGGYGGYGYGGYYDGYRNGYNNGLYGGRSSGYGTKTHYGPRRDGAREAVSSSAGSANGGRGRGRIDEGGVANPNGGVSNSGGLLNGGSGNGQPTVVPGRGRGRIVDASTGSTPSDAPIRQPLNSSGNSGRDLTDQQIKDQESRFGQPTGTAEQPRLDAQPARGRGRMTSNGSVGSSSGTDVSPATPQDYAQPRRARYRDAQPTQAGGGNEAQPQQRPARQRMSGGDFSQPSQSEQPVRQQRTYSEPSRNSSSPGGNSGGSESGGGGSRGRGRMQ